MRFAAASLRQACRLRPRRRDAARSAVVLRRASRFAPARRRRAYRRRAGSQRKSAPRAQIYLPRPRYARTAPLHAASASSRALPPFRPCLMRSTFAASLSKFSVFARFAVNLAAFPPFARALLKRSASCAFFSWKIFSPLDYFDALATISVIYHRVIRQTSQILQEGRRAG